MLLDGQQLVMQAIESQSGDIERLRQILSQQQDREVSLQEAQEIGLSLLEFYQILAEEVIDDTNV